MDFLKKDKKNTASSTPTPDQSMKDDHFAAVPPPPSAFAKESSAPASADVATQASDNPFAPVAQSSHLDDAQATASSSDNPFMQPAPSPQDDDSTDPFAAPKSTNTSTPQTGEFSVEHADFPHDPFVANQAASTAGTSTIPSAPAAQDITDPIRPQKPQFDVAQDTSLDNSSSQEQPLFQGASLDQNSTATPVQSTAQTSEVAVQEKPTVTGSENPFEEYLPDLPDFPEGELLDGDDAFSPEQIAQVEDAAQESEAPDAAPHRLFNSSRPAEQGEVVHAPLDDKDVHMHEEPTQTARVTTPAPQEVDKTAAAPSESTKATTTIEDDGEIYVDSHNFYEMLQEVKALKRTFKDADAAIVKWNALDTSSEEKMKHVLTTVDTIQEDLIKIDTALFER